MAGGGHRLDGAGCPPNLAEWMEDRRTPMAAIPDQDADLDLQPMHDDRGAPEQPGDGRRCRIHEAPTPGPITTGGESEGRDTNRPNPIRREPAAADEPEGAKSGM